jgi:hypothetical protein
LQSAGYDDAFTVVKISEVFAADESNETKRTEKVFIIEDVLRGIMSVIKGLKERLGANIVLVSMSSNFYRCH